MSKRKLEESKDEQGPPKRTRLQEIGHEQLRLLNREKEIRAKLEETVKPLKEQIEQATKIHDEKHAVELKEIKLKQETLADEEEVCNVLDELQELIKAAKENPKTLFLFDDRRFRSEEADERWQPVCDLINKELGGYIECFGYFALKATG